MNTNTPPPDDAEMDVDEVVEENEAHVTFDITSYPSDLTLSGVNEMHENGEIVIPDFQRNFVWNIRQASLLIESFLLGLPVPQVFLYVDEENKYQVIDGQQRIMSVVFYLSGYFGSENLDGKKQVFRLQGLDGGSPFANKTFAELDEVQQRKLKGAVLRAINIRQLNPKGEPTSIYYIFERLNTGGTPLKPQEIRNCVFRGEFALVLRELNKDKNWRLILGKKTFDRHQKDVELVLRTFAMSYFFDNYEKPMKHFLNETMRLQKKNSAKVEQFKSAFAATTKLIVEKLGPKAFHLRGPLNSSALDTVFSTLLNAGSTIPGDVKERYQKLVADERFKQTTFYSTSDVVVVKERFELTSKYLLG